MRKIFSIIAVLVITSTVPSYNVAADDNGNIYVHGSYLTDDSGYTTGLITTSVAALMMSLVWFRMFSVDQMSTATFPVLSSYSQTKRMFPSASLSLPIAASLGRLRFGRNGISEAAKVLLDF
jgi:hypothetical protein